MSTGDREEWRQYLPLSQAFVDGKPIQERSYDKRWKDCNTMYQLRNSEYRIKPDGLGEGVWTQEYEFQEVGTVDGPLGTGTFTWKGSNKDTPPFKSGNGFKLLGAPKFTKDKP